MCVCVCDLPRRIALSLPPHALAPKTPMERARGGRRYRIFPPERVFPPVTQRKSACFLSLSLAKVCACVCAEHTSPGEKGSRLRFSRAHGTSLQRATGGGERAWSSLYNAHRQRVAECRVAYFPRDALKSRYFAILLYTCVRAYIYGKKVVCVFALGG